MPLVDASDSVLLVIDTQPDFYQARADVDLTAFKDFVARVAWIAGVARALGAPIVETVERPEKNGDTAAEVRHAIGGSSARFEKDAFAASANPLLREHLAGLGRQTAVIVGMETDVCVAHSAIGLIDLGWRVVAATDALYAPGDAHAQGLARLRQVGVELLAAKGLFYEWLPSVSQVRSFKQANPELRSPPFQL